MARANLTIKTWVNRCITRHQNLEVHHTTLASSSKLEILEGDEQGAFQRTLRCPTLQLIRLPLAIIYSSSLIIIVWFRDQTRLCHNQITSCCRISLIWHLYRWARPMATTFSPLRVTIWSPTSSLIDKSKLTRAMRTKIAWTLAANKTTRSKKFSTNKFVW